MAGAITGDKRTQPVDPMESPAKCNAVGLGEILSRGSSRPASPLDRCREASFGLGRLLSTCPPYPHWNRGFTTLDK
jgi:hypothetical protein